MSERFPIPTPEDDVWWQGGEGRRTEAAWHLLSLMSEHSEDVFCATWMSGLDFSLWAIGVGDREGHPSEEPQFSSGLYSAPLCRRLVAMAELLGIWWTWLGISNYIDDETGRQIWNPNFVGPRAVPLDTWRRIYAGRRKIDARDWATITRYERYWNRKHPQWRCPSKPIDFTRRPAS